MEKTIQKVKRKNYLIFLLLLSCSYGVIAQTISGTVRENITNLPLPGAEVVIKGTSIGSSTDFDGKFNLIYDDPSSVTLTITYLGFETQEIDVSTYSDPSNITVMLKEASESLGEVVISANVEGQRKALNLQRTADNIKNVISTDLISRFPDLNVADALQRVPGVNIDLDNGEGAGVTIRGTPPNFTTVTINGEQVQNTGTSFDRTTQLTQFPVDQLSQIEVTKSPTPDMDGDAIGGSVNLSTPKARRLDLGMKAEVGGGYNGLSDGVNFIGKLAFNKRFAASDKNPNGTFGLDARGSFFQTDNGEDRTQSQWRSSDNFSNSSEEQYYNRQHTLRYLETTRTRSGASITADYKFDSNNFIVTKFNYAGLREDEVRQRKQFRTRDAEDDPDDSDFGFISPTLFEGARIRHSYRDRVVDRFTTSLNLDGHFKISNLKITGGYAYSGGRRQEDGFRGRFGTGRDQDIAIQGLNSDFPILYPANGTPNSDFNPEDFTWDRHRVYSSTVSSNSSTAKINFELPITINESLLTLKTGYKNRITAARQFYISNFFSYEGDEDITLAQFEATGDLRSDWLKNEVPFGFGINPSLANTFFENNTNSFERQINDQIEQEENNKYTADENTNAAYFMAKLRTGKFNILAGARYEKVDVDYTASAVSDNDGDFSVIPVVDGADYDFLLPNIQIKYELTDLTNIRLAYTHGYARPNFADLIPRINADIEGEELQVGNATLDPESAINYDFQIEHYLSNVGIISGGFFYKDLDSFLFEDVFIIEDGTEFAGAENFIGFEARQPRNGDEATLLGAEVNIQTNLGFISPAVKPFGLYFNYTYTDSDATINGEDGRRIPGQAPHTGNTALTFDKSGFSARVNLNYQGERVESIAGDLINPGDNDEIRASRFTLDANASYTWKKRWRVYAEANNLTDAEQVVFRGDKSRISDFRYFGIRSTFGISYTF